jgi:mono/diheme cytochrome c family protein
MNRSMRGRIFAAVMSACVASMIHGSLQRAAADEPSPDLGASAEASANPFGGDPAARSEGRGLFNQYCSHCHAPNAVNPDPPKDLRRLKIRYGDRMPSVFFATVAHGRPDKGMPAWNDVIDEATMWKIFTFLESVQTPP